MSDRIAQLESTSAILGEYMLRGWALTDLSCDKCHVTPLMREPPALAAQRGSGSAQIQFCALCDGEPDGVQPSAIQSSLSVSSPQGQPVQLSGGTNITDSGFVQSPFGPIPAGPSYTSPLSPPPPQTQPQALLPDPSESISSLLLQGYSLLGTNCPNPSCRGIPLVGYPKRKDGLKDGRKICVSCNGAWVDEADMGSMGMTVLQPTVGDVEDGQGVVRSGGEVGGESPRSKARRELYETGERIVQKQKEDAERDVKGKGREEKNVEEVDMDLDDLGEENADSKGKAKAQNNTPTDKVDSPLDGSLSRMNTALANTLDTLSNSLTRHTDFSQSADQSRLFVDVKLHTEAIKDVLGVVEMISRIRR